MKEEQKLDPIEQYEKDSEYFISFFIVLGIVVFAVSMIIDKILIFFNEPDR